MYISTSASHDARTRRQSTPCGRFSTKPVLALNIRNALQVPAHPAHWRAHAGQRCGGFWKPSAVTPPSCCSMRAIMGSSIWPMGDCRMRCACSVYLACGEGGHGAPSPHRYRPVLPTHVHTLAEPNQAICARSTTNVQEETFCTWHYSFRLIKTALQRSKEAATGMPHVACGLSGVTQPTGIPWPVSSSTHALEKWLQLLVMRSYAMGVNWRLRSASISSRTSFGRWVTLAGFDTGGEEGVRTGRGGCQALSATWPPAGTARPKHQLATSKNWQSLLIHC